VFPVITSVIPDFINMARVMKYFGLILLMVVFVSAVDVDFDCPLSVCWRFLMAMGFMM